MLIFHSYANVYQRVPTLVTHQPVTHVLLASTPPRGSFHPPGQCDWNCWNHPQMVGLWHWCPRFIASDRPDCWFFEEIQWVAWLASWACHRTCNCDHGKHAQITSFRSHCPREKILSSTSKLFSLHIHNGKIWKIPNVYIYDSLDSFFSGESTTMGCQTNFPPRNAAVQRVPVPKKGRTEVEFVMNGMRQKWCIASCCNVIGFYQLLSFWPEKTGPRTQTCFKSIEKRGFVSPFQGVQQGIMGCPFFSGGSMASGLPSHSQISTKCHACALGCGQNALAARSHESLSQHGHG